MNEFNCWHPPVRLTSPNMSANLLIKMPKQYNVGNRFCYSTFLLVIFLTLVSCRKLPTPDSDVIQIILGK